MATSLSSLAFAIPVSSLKARNCGNSACFSSPNPFRFNSISSPHAPASSHKWLSRKLYRIQATTLQDNEEKVVVEESFQAKSFPDDEGEGSRGEPESSSSSVLETWTIKFEQSVNIFLTDSVIKILDTLYHDRNYPRFYVLETIARVPYFAFISVLHLYESFGWWRKADYLKVHFAESWNEMHHLLIMEELGGDAWWVDRFLAQHIAVFYYFMTVFMYMISPRMAYHFSECVEHHAYSTYDKFIMDQGEELKKMPAPEVAVKYYTGGDLYLFDEFQTSRVPCTRRPKIDNLYDTFINIRDDEAEHCKTMKACQTPGNLRSPHSYPEDTFEDESGFVVPQADYEGVPRLRPGLILRGTVGRRSGDLSQENLLHPQGLEPETSCLSDQSPFHSGQPSLQSALKIWGRCLVEEPIAGFPNKYSTRRAKQYAHHTDWKVPPEI